MLAACTPLSRTSTRPWIGALYLDGGWDVAEAFITRTLKPHLADERAEHPSNPKSYLQECVQSDRMDPPAYKVIGEDGPAHQPTFTAVALVDGIPSRARHRFLQKGGRGGCRS